MSDKGITDQSWLAQEPLATDLYEPASDEVEVAARAKIDDPEMLYLSLVRALRRRKGFGILFLQCTPAKGQEIFSRLEKDLHKKKIGRLTLAEPIGNLFTLVRDRKDVDTLNVLFIEGIDKSLSPYIKSETGRNDYYKLEVLPPVLANVNRLRENFREQFPHLCFVFVVPPFALKYFMHRAIDFFSWHSGIWRFAPDSEHLTQAMAKALGEKYAKYAALSEEERNQKIAALQNLIDVPNQSDEKRSQLYVEQSWVFSAAQEFEVALRCCQEAINLTESNEDAWYAKGVALSNLGRYEDAIAAFDKALAIKPEKHQALLNKGSALHELGCYEDAIITYEKALKIKPNDHNAPFNKGCALNELGRHEDAITAYNEALKIKPNDHNAPFNKGYTFGELGRYEDAITAYDKALKIKPDDHQALYSKGCALSKLSHYEDAIAAYNKALEIKPNKHQALLNKGFALHKLGRYEDAITAYDKALEIKPDKHKALVNKSSTLFKMRRYKVAISTVEQAFKIAPDKITLILKRNLKQKLPKWLTPILTPFISLAFDYLSSQQHSHSSTDKL